MRGGPPGPDPDRRTSIVIYMRPSLLAKIDDARKGMTRSGWLEEAIRAHLATTRVPKPQLPKEPTR